MLTEIRGRSKTSKIRSLNVQTLVCHYAIVASVSPKTVEVKINDAAQR